ncbi:MAG: hypothetical protein ABIP08_05115 [Lautropia sp.]
MSGRALAQFLAGLALDVLGAELLVRSTTSMAVKAGIKPVAGANFLSLLLILGLSAPALV